jgi:hypothetical protein
VEIPEELMLSEVWGQEPELRRDTIEWLYSFQLSAYSGLSDADIEAYTAFSATDAGNGAERGALCGLRHGVQPVEL